MAELSGLILTPILNPAGRAALDVHFEPAMIISARKVDKLGLSIKSFRVPLTRAVKEVMIPSIQQNFDEEGPGWDELAVSTQRQREYTGHTIAHPILQRTRALKVGMSRFNIWHIDTEKAFIQDIPQSIWYGKVHQAGSSFSKSFVNKGPGDAAAAARAISWRGRTSRTKMVKVWSGRDSDDEGDGEIPARPFVVLHADDEEKIREVFVRWLDERIAMAGLK